jgi:hypothetical protein
VYGATRATLTLLSVVGAGFLLWLADQLLDPSSSRPSTWEFWGWLGLCAAAGLALALGQLLGGWTKWGWPRVSGSVFLAAFVPTLIVGAWIAATFDPSQSWLQRHVADWSDDIGIDGLVNDLGGSILQVSAIAVIVGLVLGFSLDTSGPRVRRGVVDEDRAAPPVPEGPAVAGAGFAEQAVPPQREPVGRDEESETPVARDEAPETRVVPAESVRDPETGEVRPPDEQPPRTDS